MIAPDASRTGDTVSEISIGRPSFARRTVSKWSTRSPRRMRASISSSSACRSGGMRIRTDCPISSEGVYPKSRSAAALHDWMMPSRFFAMMASSDDSTIAARYDCANAAALRSFGTVGLVRFLRHLWLYSKIRNVSRNGDVFYRCTLRQTASKALLIVGNRRTVECGASDTAESAFTNLGLFEPPRNTDLL